MEILFITHKYPPSIGGMEKQSYELINRFKSLGMVHTIIYDQRKESRLWFFVKLRSRIKAMLQAYPSIDLIHLNDGLLAALTRWLPGYTRIPITATFHGLDVVFPAEIYQKKVVPCYTNLAGCIAVSEATKEELIIRGIPDHKIYVVSNGVDHAIAQPKLEEAFKVKLGDRIGVSLTDKKILVAMGRPVKRKGFSWFLKSVFPHLAEDSILLMIGPFNSKPTWTEILLSFFSESVRAKIELFFGLPSDVRQLGEEIKKWKPTRRVFHLGKLPFDEVKQVLSLADVFIMPNVSVAGDAEGFGLVALEANLRKTPVLAADLEGIKDAVINQENGWLVKSGDVEEWIFKIYEVFADQNKLQESGIAACAYAKNNYSWEKMTKGYYDIFSSLLDGTKNSSEEKRLEKILNMASHAKAEENKKGPSRRKPLTSKLAQFQHR